MKGQIIVATVWGLSWISLQATEEAPPPKAEQSESEEVAEAIKPPSKGSTQSPAKRRWTKRTKPGAPKARKATPSRKKVVTSEEKSDQTISSAEDED
jgi:hypothetical protein